MCLQNMSRCCVIAAAVTLHQLHTLLFLRHSNSPAFTSTSSKRVGMLFAMFNVLARACSRERGGDMCAGAMHSSQEKRRQKARPPGRAQRCRRRHALGR
jgi:hypothetical protein